MTNFAFWCAEKDSVKNAKTGIFFKKAKNANREHFCQCQDGKTPKITQFTMLEFLTPRGVKMSVTSFTKCRKTLKNLPSLRIFGKLPYKLTGKNVSNFLFLAFGHFSQRGRRKPKRGHMKKRGAFCIFQNAYSQTVVKNTKNGCEGAYFRGEKSVQKGRWGALGVHANEVRHLHKKREQE